MKVQISRKKIRSSGKQTRFPIVRSWVVISPHSKPGVNDVKAFPRLIFALSLDSLVKRREKSMGNTKKGQIYIVISTLSYTKPAIYPEIDDDFPIIDSFTLF